MQYTIIKVKFIITRVGKRTSGTVEGWFYILMQTDHLKHQLRPYVFIEQHSPILHGRQLSYVDGVTQKEKKALKVCEIHGCMYVCST